MSGNKDRRHHGDHVPRNSIRLAPTNQTRFGDVSETNALLIPETSDYLTAIRLLVHDKEILKGYGHTVEKLSNETLQLKKRCSGCNSLMSRCVRTGEKNIVQLKKDHGLRKEHSQNTSLAANGGASVDQKRTAEEEVRMRCKFHNGNSRNKIWTCCGGPPAAPPCQQREHHIPRIYGAGVIENLWQFHPTTDGKATPLHQSVVAIDCEMGTALSGDSELIRVTLLEYFTGKILVDRLVYPDIPMLHLNTRFSGVRLGDMERARRERTCFFGRDNARKAVMKYVGPSTVVVGHAVHNDLNSLRWIHLQIVDTHILWSERIKKENLEKASLKSTLASPSSQGTEHQAQQESAATLSSVDGGEAITANATPIDISNVTITKTEDKATVKKKAPKGSGPTSLKTLARTQLDREIQAKGAGHDSIEDALAARDLLHAYATIQMAPSVVKLAEMHNSAEYMIRDLSLVEETKNGLEQRTLMTPT